MVRPRLNRLTTAQVFSLFRPRLIFGWNLSSVSFVKILLLVTCIRAIMTKISLLLVDSFYACNVE